MASRLTNAARAVGDRAKTVLGEDWGAIKRGTREVADSVREDYRWATGSSGRKTASEP